VPSAVPYSSSATTTMKTPAYTGCRAHARTPIRNAQPIVPETSAAGSTVTPATPHVAATAAAATRSALERLARSVASESPPR
jgi:hypothetical protein